LGKSDFIKKARRVRKSFGGGMRQAGFLAAAGIYALNNNIVRLSRDHSHARQIAEAISKKSFVRLVLPVETNIIIFELDDSITAAELVARLKDLDILGYAIAPNRVRLVVHLDITEQMVKETLTVFSSL
jgi:threonine aldolase